MKVEVIRAWPRYYERQDLEMPPGSCVADALLAAGISDDTQTVAYAVYGARVDLGTALHEGDRIELLRPLLADPKEARRRRADTGRKAR